jgi:hypothetical protein
MPRKKKVFISYDYDCDRHYKNLLLAWDSLKHFEFSMNDHSADVSINSTNASTIKAVITRFIHEADYFSVIIGPKTHTSEWVLWEIEKAIELNRKIIVIKTNRKYITPPKLLGIGASWAMSFTHQTILKAFNTLSNK